MFCKIKHQKQLWVCPRKTWRDDIAGENQYTRQCFPSKFENSRETLDRSVPVSLFSAQDIWESGFELEEAWYLIVVVKVRRETKELGMTLQQI